MEGDLEVDLEIDLEGDFRGDFKQDLEGDLLSSSGQLRSKVCSRSGFFFFFINEMYKHRIE